MNMDIYIMVKFNPSVPVVLEKKIIPICYLLEIYL